MGFFKVASIFIAICIVAVIVLLCVSFFQSNNEAQSDDEMLTTGEKVKRNLSKMIHSVTPSSKTHTLSDAVWNEVHAMKQDAQHLLDWKVIHSLDHYNELLKVVTDRLGKSPAEMNKKFLIQQETLQNVRMVRIGLEARLLQTAKKPIQHTDEYKRAIQLFSNILDAAQRPVEQTPATNTH